MDTRLLEILVCPLCKSALTHDRTTDELICQVDKLAYPIQDGIPVLLVDQARQTVAGKLLEPVDSKPQ
ncbi:MAG: hypothetical protein ON057_000991 [Glomeribacter sp. 1016415]|uniref:UPF0434 protein MCB1EB_2150 n=1 Tax=Mycoavidus cysteinexigens TaxID=1553431 RepID=A0A2Z6EXZ3_9BURK|nr:Trm112 family protein [Mycoavidus cysteinexigens]MCX8566264.1 hypothetical protein [Glomeribacter sp. 1016415]BBE10311.1 protein of unknown function Duf343 [Mycoavidus cysteinexigens]GAM53317.1 hypothetical protein EBME_1780 [bacterium endosymbiont of Mortierella elongata FMR23-6]GLR00728.1 UPF0434 protein [Mycoavidus cysteinexigens]